MNDFERDLARHLMKCELEYRAKKQAESSCVDWLVPYCNSINDIVAFLHSLGFRIARIVDDEPVPGEKHQWVETTSGVTVYVNTELTKGLVSKTFRLK